MTAGRPAVVCAFLSACLLTATAAPSHSTTPWYTETIQVYAGDYIRCAIDHEGNPHVVYWDYINTFVMYATRVNGAWITDVVAAEVYLGTDLDIAVDSQNVPHISYHAFNAVAADELRYATRSGGTWSVETIDNGKYNAIAIDSQDRPHVVYSTSGALKYAVKTGAWSIQNVDNSGGTYVSLALDASDHPHVAYYSSGISGVRYAVKIVNWEYEDLGTQAADYTGIVITPAGEPAIHCRNGGYVNLYVRDAGGFNNLGGFTSAGDIDGALAIDNEGNMHIFYQSLANAANDLWYVPVVNQTGFPEPVVQTGPNVTIAEKCDIGTDPYGNPLGVYYDGTHSQAMFVDSGVRLSSALAGDTWPVGSERTITWRGAGSVNVYLSTNGGASYEALALNINNSLGNGSYTFTVPHQPSRFCKVKLVRTSPYAASFSDSLFTIEASVALLNLTVTPGSEGTALAWSTDPGPADLSGYRVDRRRGDEAWVTLVSETRETSFTDASGRGGDEYRLFAINGLGEEMLLGNSSAATALTALEVYPNPFRAGDFTVRFATAGGLGGGAGHATVAVYDVAGHLVRTLADQSYAAGMQRVTWDGRDDAGAPIAGGVYFIRSTSGAETTTKKVLVVR